MIEKTSNDAVLERVSGLTSLQKRLLHEKLKAVTSDAPTGGGRLIAFYQSENPVDDQVLRDRCGKVLPAHMVPQRFIHTSRLALTNTGKIDRQAMRVEAWLSPDRGASAGDDLTKARNEIEAELSSIWCDVLGIDEISVFDNFFEVGGDSLQIIRILSRASKAGLTLKPDAIFSHPTIAELAREAGAEQDVDSDTDVSPPVDAHGDLPLLPIQRWFFDVVQSHPHHWNQSYLFTLARPVALEKVRTAIGRLLSDHAALRTCFFDENGEWFAQIVETMDPEVIEHDVSDIATADRLLAMERASTACNQSFSLSDGPLFKAVCFVEGGQVTDVNLVAHHLIVDAVSWQRIISELDKRLSTTDAVTATRETPLRQWSEALAAMAVDDEFSQALNYWERQASLSSVSLPRCLSEASETDNTEGECQWVNRRLDRDTTTMLRGESPKTLRCSVQELLLAALVTVLSRWTGSSSLTLDLEGHGREALFDDMDVSSTVGWCTSVFPVNFIARQSARWDSASDALRDVKEQFRAVPHSGLSHGVFRYADTPSSELVNCPRANVLFNYLGVESTDEQERGTLTLSDARFGMTRHPDSVRAYQLELNAVIQLGELSIDWAFGPSLHERATVERLADELIEEIYRLVHGENETNSTVVSPTDFPMSGLDQSALDNLSSQLDDLDDEL